ncbi:hypothetical protein E9993_14335 [Labilibacter sediminis]|nr:hypothetical protein E9993_14335 [Labilibacter sediminis]
MVNRIIVFVVFFLILNGPELLCQDNYPVRGTVFVREGNASGINLTITTADTKEKVPVDIKGNFTALLQWHKVHQLCFSKKGYVTKIIEFSTKIPEDVAPKYIYPYEILIELFPIFPDVDTVFFKKPVAKIQYNKLYNDFDYDTEYLLSVKYKLDKVKTNYYKWKNLKEPAVKPKKEESTKKQNINAVQYEKSIEVKKSKVVPEPTSSPIKEPIADTAKNPFNLPALKEVYPQGKSIEIFKLKGKQITRVIIQNGEFRKVFYKVKHDWGGLFYFVQESPSKYRSISKYNFQKSTNI